MRRRSADRKPAGGGEAAGERSVDVLVGEVERRRVGEAGHEANGEAESDDRAEGQARRHRREAAEGETVKTLRSGSRDVDGHGSAIGTSAASLEGVMLGLLGGL